MKIFGDIHGQYADLMRFFDIFGAPTTDDHQYLFLGDYVDRGNQSLETVCLLLALKVAYPHRIHLLRGNHEDAPVNRLFGFAQECFVRLAEDSDCPASIYASLNQLFRYLPLAATIRESVFCLHGGLGATLRHVSQLEQLRRPLDLHYDGTAEQQLLHDALWSDPCDEPGVHANPERDPMCANGITKFGPDVVEQFLRLNSMQAIVRAHECVMEGIEKMAGKSTNSKWAL